MQQRRYVVFLSGGYDLCRDPEDNKSIETAIRRRAPIIVSRDPDLCADETVERLRELHISVLSPEYFLEVLHREG